MPTYWRRRTECDNISFTERKYCRCFGDRPYAHSILFIFCLNGVICTTCYTEMYQSWEVVTAGKPVPAYMPQEQYIGYETGSPNNGCYYFKCANGYAHYMSNDLCNQGHRDNLTWASGYPACPHGYLGGGSRAKYAHCQYDTEYYEPGYRAPCGRTTHTDDIYGYVTRTRTTTYTEETVPGDHVHIHKQKKIHR